MKIKMQKGKYGKDDRIILFTSTRNDVPAVREPVTVFKIALLVNQLAYNELQVKNGFKKRLLKRGEPLYFEEAIKEAIEMAKRGINWAETHNFEAVKAWAKKWNVKVEDIESELRRTFQRGIDEFLKGDLRGGECGRGKRNN